MAKPSLGKAQPANTLSTEPARTLVPASFGHDPKSLSEAIAQAAFCLRIRVGSRVWLKGSDPKDGYVAYYVIGRWQKDLWLHNFLLGRRHTASISEVIAFTRS